MAGYKILLSLLFVLIFFALPKATLAVTFNLIPPSNQLTRGGNAQFILLIDTEGSAVTSTQIGLSYDTQYLKYVNTTPGAAMEVVSVDQSTNGQLILSGTNTNGFNGSDKFAFVTFQIIAQASGSTELCTMFIPSPTPTPTSLPTPTSPFQEIGPIGSFGTDTPVPESPTPSLAPQSINTTLTPTTTPIVTIAPTKPVPTALPKTGSTNQVNILGITAGFLVASSIAIYTGLKKTKYSYV